MAIGIIYPQDVEYDRIVSYEDEAMYIVEADSQGGSSSTTTTTTPKTTTTSTTSDNTIVRSTTGDGPRTSDNTVRPTETERGTTDTTTSVTTTIVSTYDPTKNDPTRGTSDEREAWVEQYNKDWQNEHLGENAVYDSVTGETTYVDDPDYGYVTRPDTSDTTNTTDTNQSSISGISTPIIIGVAALAAILLFNKK